MVEQPMEIGIDDLLARMPLEERVYRLRCVEAWSMTVPYSGFPMKALVDLARPLSSAKYVKMTTFQDPEVAGGQRAAWYPWPYIEGLTMAEARHELRSEEHTSELQSLMRISYAVFCLKKKKKTPQIKIHTKH